MNTQVEPLSIFLAVPGANFGDHAKWSRPADVLLFYEKVRKALEIRLNRSVLLQVEKERQRAGVIYNTMFQAAREADVFIADLTGANPNVFLELGVRFALRRGITLLLSQDTARTPFNVEHMRIIQYANGSDDIAIEKIVHFVEEALATKDYCDSPVLDVLDLVSVGRQEWIKVSGERVRQLLKAAESAASLDRSGALLREAVETDPLHLEARLELTRFLRRRASYVEALSVLDEGIRLGEEEPRLYLERGLLLGRLPPDSEGDPGSEAVSALRKAAHLDPSNRDALASLGGALRRLALQDAPPGGNPVLLQEAAECYLASLKLNKYDTYPALNLVRLGFLLNCTGAEGVSWDNAALLQKTYHLCAFETVDKPHDHWRILDLADSLLFLGKPGEGEQQYRRAIDLIPLEKRADDLRSPLSTLKELLEAKAMPEAAVQPAMAVTALLQQEILASSQANRKLKESQHAQRN